MDTADCFAGKDYRAWLRENGPQSTVPMPLNEMLKVACEDAPYNNRQGTWPDILMNWLPYFLDNSQYKQGEMLMNAAFRHTNAKEDQKNWSTTLLQMSTRVRRRVFKQSLTFLTEAMRTSARGKSLLTSNMQGVFGDPSWIEPVWFDKWPRAQTLPVLSHTGVMKDTAGALLQEWLKAKATQQERLSLWLADIRAHAIHTPSYAKEVLQLLPLAWNSRLYEPSVGKAFFSALTDEELMLVTQHLNKHLDAKSGAPVLRDCISQWLRRPQAQCNWLALLAPPNKAGVPTVSTLGKTLKDIVETWPRVAKEKRWSQQEKKLLLLACASQQCLGDPLTLRPQFDKEEIPPGIIDLIQTLDVRKWQDISIMANNQNAPLSIQACLDLPIL